MSHILLTDAAATHVKTMLEKEKDAVGFRVSMKKYGCSGFRYEAGLIKEKSAGDVHFMSEHHIPVFIDPNYAEWMNGMTIDYASSQLLGLGQKQLVFINPKEKQRCGCGSSVSME